MGMGVSSMLKSGYESYWSPQSSAALFTMSTLKFDLLSTHNDARLQQCQIRKSVDVLYSRCAVR